MQRPAALVALALASAPTLADIVSVAGQTTLIGAPAVADQFGLNGPNAFAFKEKQAVVLPLTPVDMVNNPGVSNAPIAGAVGGLLDSHMIHFAPLGTPVSQVSGSVTFDSAIVGVSFTQPMLDITDASAGAGGTVYPTGDFFRTTSLPSVFSIVGNVLNFDLVVAPGTSDYEQIRVFTRPIPTPGSASLLGLGALTALRRRRTA